MEVQEVPHPVDTKTRLDRFEYLHYRQWKKARTLSLFLPPIKKGAVPP